MKDSRCVFNCIDVEAALNRNTAESIQCRECKHRSLLTYIDKVGLRMRPEVCRCNDTESIHATFEGEKEFWLR